MRHGGQQLMAVLIQFATRTNGGEAFLQEGQRLAGLYGEINCRAGLSLIESLHAFMLVRRSINDSLRHAGTLSGPPDADTWRLYERVATFLDAMLLASVEGFERAQARSSCPISQNSEQPRMTDSSYPPPRLVFWETTAGCNLACIHCRRITVADQLVPQDLSTVEAFDLVDQIAAFARPIFVLSGGEPLFRPDIFDIARHASDAGLIVALATNGTLIDCRDRATHP